MKQISEYYEQAVRLIAEGTDPEHFAQHFYDSFQIPIIIVDEAYKLLAFANGGCFEDPYWEAIVKNGAAHSETITKQYLKAGYLESISSSDGAICVDWGVSRDYPQSCGPVYVNKELMGFISLLFLKEEKKEEACRLNAMVCSLFAVLLQTSEYQRKTMRNPIRQLFARKFFDPDSISEPLDPDSFAPHVNISPDYQVAVIGTFREEDPLREFLRGRIRSLYPDVIYQFKDQRLFLILGNRVPEESIRMQTKFQDILTDYNLHAGISERFSDTSRRSRYIEQADAALDAGMMTKPEQCVFFFDHIFPAVIFSKASSALLPENLLPKELVLLAAYDAAHETEYLETLRGYLYERNDLNRAAAYLHVHRNTLRYRLEKIRQITGAEPDEDRTALRLEIGFGMRDLLLHR